MEQYDEIVSYKCYKCGGGMHKNKNVPSYLPKKYKCDKCGIIEYHGMYYEYYKEEINYG